MAQRLLIVDDHAGFRYVARTMLTDAGFDIAGEAPDGETALAVVDQLDPDVVLLDVTLPGIDGFEVARQLAQRSHAPMVVLTSSRPRSVLQDRLASCPVRGYLAKEELTGEALTALLP
jgi:DNA-binding NarL/FixJ family response regulator